MVAISYFAVVSYSRSINTLTHDYLTQLVQRIAEQTDSVGHSYLKYLDILVKYPFVQLSFSQYPLGGQFGTVQEKLELFRVNTESFDRITLYANDGRIVTDTPLGTKETIKHPTIDIQQFTANNEKHHQVAVSDGNQKILLYQRVYDFRAPKRLMGVVVVEVAFDRFIKFIQQLNIGSEIQKTVTTGDGTIIYQEAHAAGNNDGNQREFTAHLPLLNWKVNVTVPDSLLLKDVNRLANRLLAFTALVALLAIGASLVVSRMAIKPLVRIIDGIKEFASGNLDFRIREIQGFETQQVAETFNAMAEELKMRQEELIQADKLSSLGLLSAGFAHEVRNPLAGIKTSAQVIAKRGLREETKNLATGISKEVDRLNKLVKDLLHFSQPQPSSKKTCDLVDIINRSLKILDSGIKEKNVKIINKVARHQITVAPEQMVQVMINLVLNALTAIESDTGIIQLHSGVSSEKGLTVTISDNGYGIPPEKLSQIFDPFFSLSKEGTGLGLSVVKLLLKNNDIKIEVESAEGEGTSFFMYFKDHLLNTEGVYHG